MNLEGNALKDMVLELENKLEEALSNDFQQRLAEQQRVIEGMQKSLEAINRRDAERKKWEELRSPSN